MPLAVLQQKLNSFPEAYFDEINAFFDLLSYKVAAQTASSAKKQKPKRQAGGLTGKFYMASDFDETPDCFKEYM